MTNDPSLEVDEATPQGDDGEDRRATVAKCFKFPSDFVKVKVESVVKDYYHGSSANLALIEITLYDHGQLKKRNAHKAFVMALVAWKIINIANEKKFKKICKGITDKIRRLEKSGYMDWGQNLANDRVICNSIGKQLGDTMPYIR